MNCPQVPISPVSLRNIKATDKTQRIFDGGGLYLEITPKGKTWWRLKYRFNDKEKRISLGVFPEVSLALARDRRDDARKLLAKEIDPGEHRKIMKQALSDRAANSFELIAREWFVKDAPIGLQVMLIKLFVVLSVIFFLGLAQPYC